MKLFFAALLLLILLSCKKDGNGGDTHCYECDFSPIGRGTPGEYMAAGCMTQAEFDALIFVDVLGNDPPLDKSKYCRKK
jgi:hypothetical protein